MNVPATEFGRQVAVDINRSSLCAHCSVAIRRRKFLVYFLLRLPPRFQPGQLQPRQHGDAWSDPANRRGYDFQDYLFNGENLVTSLFYSLRVDLPCFSFYSSSPRAVSEPKSGNVPSKSDRWQRRKTGSQKLEAQNSKLQFGEKVARGNWRQHEAAERRRASVEPRPSGLRGAAKDAAFNSVIVRLGVVKHSRCPGCTKASGAALPVNSNSI